MTRLTYILLLIPFLNYGQIDPTVLPLLNEWKNEARKNGEWEAPGKVAKHLGGVKFVTFDQMDKLTKGKFKPEKMPLGIVSWEVQTGLYGYAFRQPVIYIQEKVRPQDNTLKGVLWHELGHFLGIKEHGGSHLMSEYYSWTDFSKPQTDYWQQIKSLPVNSHWKKSDNTFY